MFFKKIWKKITNKKEYQYLKSIENNKKSNEEFKVKFEPYINNIQNAGYIYDSTLLAVKPSAIVPS